MLNARIGSKQERRYLAISPYTRLVLNPSKGLRPKPAISAAAKALIKRTPLASWARSLRLEPVHLRVHLVDVFLAEELGEHDVSVAQDLAQEPSELRVRWWRAARPLNGVLIV